MAIYSSRDLSLVPQITFTFVEEYIKEKKKSSGTKLLGRGFKYYSENYVHGLSVEKKDNKPTIYGKCYHSQKKSETPNKMNVTFESVRTAIMDSALCSCPIGQTGACGHVVGLFYQLAKFKMLNAKAFPEDVARTSQPQSWHEPRGERIQGKAVQDLTVSGYSSQCALYFHMSEKM